MRLKDCTVVVYVTINEDLRARMIDGLLMMDIKRAVSVHYDL